MLLVKLLAVALLVIATSGCAIVASPSIGFLYTNVQGPVATGKGTGASKTGEACATNILGLISTGDASIDAAKKSGNIQEVATVDHSSKMVLGLYGRYCTVVKGE